jgi:hypothetical protein
MSENIVHGSNEPKGKSNRKQQKARLTNDRTQQFSEITPDKPETKANRKVRGYFILKCKIEN